MYNPRNPKFKTLQEEFESMGLDPDEAVEVIKATGAVDNPLIGVAEPRMTIRETDRSSGEQLLIDSVLTERRYTRAPRGSEKSKNRRAYRKVRAKERLRLKKYRKTAKFRRAKRISKRKLSRIKPKSGFRRHVSGIDQVANIVDQIESITAFAEDRTHSVAEYVAAMDKAEWICMELADRFDLCGNEDTAAAMDDLSEMAHNVAENLLAGSRVEDVEEEIRGIVEHVADAIVVYDDGSDELVEAIPPNAKKKLEPYVRELVKMFSSPSVTDSPNIYVTSKHPKWAAFAKKLSSYLLSKLPDRNERMWAIEMVLDRAFKTGETLSRDQGYFTKDSRGMFYDNDSQRFASPAMLAKVIAFSGMKEIGRYKPAASEEAELGTGYEVSESFVDGSVRSFYGLLSHVLTAYDRSLSRREAKSGLTNIYRLSHLLGAAQKAQAEAKKANIWDSDSANDLESFRKMVRSKFTEKFAPIVKWEKSLDKFLSSGKLPSLKSDVEYDDLEMGEAKTKFKVGDKVLVTNEGLRWHSKQTSASSGFSGETIRWRNALGKFADNKVIGVVSRVFPSGHVNVTFPGDQVYGVPSEMLKKARGESVDEGVAAGHQEKIAAKTLKLNKVGASMLGGPDHKEAVAILRRSGWSDLKIRKTLEKAGHSESDIKSFMEDRSGVYGEIYRGFDSILEDMEIEESVGKLSKAQIDEIKKEMVKDGVPVRFLKNGLAFDILSGVPVSKGSSIMYHPVYWNFTKDTAKKIADWLGAKAVFSEDVDELGEGWFDGWKLSDLKRDPASTFDSKKTASLQALKVSAKRGKIEPWVFNTAKDKSRFGDMKVIKKGRDETGNFVIFYNYSTSKLNKLLRAIASAADYDLTGSSSMSFYVVPPLDEDTGVLGSAFGEGVSRKVVSRKLSDGEIPIVKSFLKRFRGKPSVLKGVRFGQKVKYKGGDYLVYDFDAESDAPFGAEIVLVSNDYSTIVSAVPVPDVFPHLKEELDGELMMAGLGADRNPRDVVSAVEKVLAGIRGVSYVEEIDRWWEGSGNPASLWLHFEVAMPGKEGSYETGVGKMGKGWTFSEKPVKVKNSILKELKKLGAVRIRVTDSPVSRREYVPSRLRHVEKPRSFYDGNVFRVEFIVDDVLREDLEIDERQKGPASQGFDDEGQYRKGAFKISKQWLSMVSEIPEVGKKYEKALFSRQLDFINKLGQDEMSAMFGVDNIPDAQDVIAKSPKKAFHLWMRNVGKVVPKIGKGIRELPEMAPLWFYAIVVRVSGRDMANIILKKYFSSEPSMSWVTKARLKKEDIEGDEDVLGESMGKMKTAAAEFLYRYGVGASSASRDRYREIISALDSGDKDTLAVFRASSDRGIRADLKKAEEDMATFSKVFRSPRKVTIYHNGGAIGIGKTEAKLIAVTGGDMSGPGGHVFYSKKGGRNIQVLMPYYSPFWVIVDGWGQPNPDDPYVPLGGDGVSVSKSKYMSADPRWETDFLDGIGKKLKVLAQLRNKKMKIFDKKAVIVREDVDESVFDELTEGFGDQSKFVKAINDRDSRGVLNELSNMLGNVLDIVSKNSMYLNGRVLEGYRRDALNILKKISGHPLAAEEWSAVFAAYRDMVREAKLIDKYDRKPGGRSKTLDHAAWLLKHFEDVVNGFVPGYGNVFIKLSDDVGREASSLRDKGEDVSNVDSLSRKLWELLDDVTGSKGDEPGYGGPKLGKR
jgi:hypothetical protein